MLNKELIALAILNAFCLVVQLLPVITVPLSSASSNFYLSKYQSYSFGLFGICDLQTGICSSPRIGYPPVNSSFYEVASSQVPDVGGVALPSSATYTISKLLVIHIVAFGFSALLFLVVIFLISLEYMEKVNKSYFLKAIRKPSSKNEDQNMVELLSRAEQEEVQNEEQKEKPRDITTYINLMLAFSMISFICTLLGLLADILLFIPNLSYVGWLQLFPVVVLTLIAAMLCFVKRAISSRRYLELDLKYDNDDMRIRNNLLDSRWNDSASDDGFYVYTNGFYSTQNNGGTATGASGDHALHHTSNSLHSGWVHHSYRNESDEEESISSEEHRETGQPESTAIPNTDSTREATEHNVHYTRTSLERD